MTAKAALVTGVGPGTGLATVRRFVEGGFRVAMIARDAERLNAIATEVPGTLACPADVTDTAAFMAAIDRAEAWAGAPEVVVHNAVGGAFGSFMTIDPAVLARNFDVNVMALMHLARRVSPAMVAAGRGAILVTGNTSALRGRANFAGFAPTKAAQRILAEAIARDLGPQGVHVAYLVIDAVIDTARARARDPDAPDDFFIQPADIAAELWHLAHQPKSAWSFLTEVRPFRETW